MSAGRLVQVGRWSLTRYATWKHDSKLWCLWTHTLCLASCSLTHCSVRMTPRHRVSRSRECVREMVEGNGRGRGRKRERERERERKPLHISEKYRYTERTTCVLHVPCNSVCVHCLNGVKLKTHFKGRTLFCQADIVAKTVCVAVGRCHDTDTRTHHWGTTCNTIL